VALFHPERVASRADPCLQIPQNKDVDRYVHRHLKGNLMELCSKTLPAAIGMTYTRVVKSCLTCLDDGQSNAFAHESEVADPEGILVGLTFIGRILSRLLSVHMFGDLD
jgi:hypothetical protein